MRAAPRTKAFCAALSLVVALLCACHAKAAEHPNGTVIWQAGTPLGKWIAANTNQCGRPVNDGPQFTFALLMDGRNCTRNQANTVDADGGLILLPLGQTYTWSWHEIDGPTPGMGPDNDARSLVWQIHGLHEPDSPCTRLAFINGPDELSKPQMWGLSICSGLV